MLIAPNGRHMYLLDVGILGNIDYYSQSVNIADFIQWTGRIRYFGWSMTRRWLSAEHRILKIQEEENSFDLLLLPCFK